MGKKYDPYEKFGLRRVINAATCLTRLGGSRPHPDVFKAMEDASKVYIRIPELQHWAGNRIAETFGAEAGLPTAGATNGLILAVAACIMKGTELEQFDPLEPQKWSHLTQRLPKNTKGLRTQFIVQKNNRNTYDHAVECAGGTMIEIGSKKVTIEKELKEAYDTDKTAGYYYTITSSKTELSIEKVAKIAHHNGVPLIVDAAPYLTHKVIPQKILDDGADLVVFSGGKHLGGPNNTGILLGRKDLIKLAHLQSYPFDGIGRAAKMSRETIVGLIKALEIFTKRDDEAYYTKLEEKTRKLSNKLNEIPGIISDVIFEPVVIEDLKGPCYVRIKMSDKVDTSLMTLHNRLLEGEPPIEALYEPYFIIPQAKGIMTIKTEHLLEGDDEIIFEKIKQICYSN